MSDYVKIICERCDKEFERFRCHPYIVKCKQCRTRKARIKGSKRFIDYHHVDVTSIRELLYAGQRGYEGRYHPTYECKLQMVTYSRGTYGKRFFRIGSMVFKTESELIAFSGLSDTEASGVR